MAPRFHFELCRKECRFLCTRPVYFESAQSHRVNFKQNSKNVFIFATQSVKCKTCLIQKHGFDSKESAGKYSNLARTTAVSLQVLAINICFEFCGLDCRYFGDCKISGQMLLLYKHAKTKIQLVVKQNSSEV